MGAYVRLEPVDVAAHGASLYRRSHARPEQVALWTYLFYGPFPDQDAFERWLADCACASDPLFLRRDRGAQRQGRRHDQLPQHRPRTRLDRDRPHLVRAAAAANPGRDRPAQVVDF